MSNSTITTEPFDDCMTFILANRFDIRELRREQHNVEAVIKLHNSGIYEYMHEIDGLDCLPFPWADYLECVRQAIQWKLETAKQRKPKTSATPSKRIDAEAIKACNNIVSVVERYIELRRAGRNYKGVCIFHADKNPSLIVYPDKQSWRCYGCQRGGDIFNFVMEAENCDFKRAAEILGGVL